MKTTKKVDRVVAEELMSTVDNFLFDCDGVLWHAGKAIPGSADVVNQLLKMGKKIFYLTNITDKTRDQLLAKCHNMGYPATKDQLLGVAYALAMYLKQMGLTKKKNAGKAYVIGNPGMAAELDELGISYTGIEPEYQPKGSVEELYEYCRQWKPDPDVKCVAVGFDPDMNFVKMTKAATYANNRNIPFLATNEDPFLATDGEVLIPGTGSIVATVKTPSRREPDVIGKPSTYMFQLLHDLHGLEASRTVMLGDSLNTDIAMAAKSGLRSILVLTGGDNLNMVEGFRQKDDDYSRVRVPDYYIDSLADLAQYIPS